MKLLWAEYFKFFYEKNYYSDIHYIISFCVSSLLIKLSESHIAADMNSNNDKELVIAKSSWRKTLGTVSYIFLETRNYLTKKFRINDNPKIFNFSHSTQRLFILYRFFFFLLLQLTFCPYSRD